jgi:hypothetical protein
VRAGGSCTWIEVWAGLDDTINPGADPGETERSMLITS